MKIVLPILCGIALGATVAESASIPGQATRAPIDSTPHHHPARPRPLWKFEATSFLERNPHWRTEEPQTLQQLAKQHSGNPALLLEAASELLSIGHTDASLILLDALLGDTTATPLPNEKGGKDLQNLHLRETTFAHAMRYHLRKSPDDLQQARRLLLAYAKVMPRWPLMLHRTRPASDEKNWVSQNDTRIYTQFASGGLWGRWYHLDLSGSSPLLRAYDLICNALPEADRSTIEENIFIFQTKLIERWPEIYHNTAVYKLEGLIRFGLVLQRPELIHRAVTLMEDLFSIGFSPDGFWHEATPAYHRQVASRLTRTFPQLLEGYSDPPGWHHPTTGQRFDNLHLSEKFNEAIATITHSQEQLTLPSGYLAALNDTDPLYYFDKPKRASHPQLLGTSGIAILGSGTNTEQQQLFINFSGTHGHEHHDINAIHWYALDAHVIDETRYRPLKGTDSSRAWSASTYAHQTVVIDEEDQPWRFSKKRRAFTQSDSIRGRTTWPLRGSAAGTNHMGDLLLFNGRQESPQVVEVEGKKGYGGKAKLYRRTVIKVDLGHGEGYLVDLFRVKGGTLHDYMLHGPLGLAHRAEFSLPLEPASPPIELGPKNAYLPKGTEKPRFIRVDKQAPNAKTPWHVTFRADTGLQLTSTLLHPDNATVLSGEAPAINHPGDAPFIAVRTDKGETLFIAVHEVYRNQKHVQSVRLLTSPRDSDSRSGVAIEIALAESQHLILATLGANDTVQAPSQHGEFSLSGRLGWLEIKEAKTQRGTLWDGTRLSYPGGAIAAPHAAFEGRVLNTLRRTAGAASNALIVASTVPEGVSLEGRTAHVDIGGELTWSYIIQKAERHGEQTLLHLEHDPGFEISSSGLAKMLYHPGWGIHSPVTLRIPLDKSFSRKETSP